jgi:hypothetical protein
MHPTLQLSLFIVFLLAPVCGIAHGQLPVIGLRSLSQSFFSPGGSYEVSITEGDHTEEVVDLVFSHPGFNADILRRKPRPPSAIDTRRYGHFAVSLSPQTPPGRYEVRVMGRFGLSNPRSILVERDLRFLTEVGHDASSGTPLTIDAMHCCRASAETRDFYTLDLVAGRRYQLSLISHGIDSRIIGAVSLIASDGRTIHSVIGNDQADLRFSFDAPDSGPLTIVVHDALFRGGPAYPYGLKITQPPETSRDEPTRHPRSITLDEGKPSFTGEQEMAIQLEVPALVEAVFDSVDDEDHYQVELRKDDPIVIEVISDRIGQPTDCRITVARSVDGASGGPTWQRIATGDDSQNVSDSIVRLATNDPRLRFVPPAEGAYRITVSDSDTGQSLGTKQRYRLSIRPPERDFDLLAYNVFPHKDAKATRPSGSLLMRGGSMTIRVFAIRKEVSEPIKVAVAKLPSGISCEPAWIAAGQNQTDLIVSAATDVQQQMAPLQIIGEANVDGEIETRFAEAASVIWEQDGYRPIVLTRLTDQLMLASSELDQAPLSIGWKNASPVSTGKETKVDLEVQIDRREGGKGGIVLRAQNLPAGVKAGDLTIPADKSEATWTVEVTDKANPGTYSFWGQGETTVKFSVNPQALARAQSHLGNLKTRRDDSAPAKEHSDVDHAIAEAEKQIETLKKQTTSKDFLIYVPSRSITLQVR